ncbi:glutaredoxin family protein [Paenibacillus aestuarii]|uniref:Glutaredoxin family protein n=1 Tax=Paenibacillus aestuarii TaxID=516965 RepID=A0ABW0KI10_9BACL|nr:glutaredoxin family protein [Paenibacillus aestuarii]
MEVIVYSSGHCASCKEAISFFEEQGIAYKQFDVEVNKEHFQEMLRLGGIATPFILIEDSAFHYFDRDKIKEVLMRTNA